MKKKEFLSAGEAARALGVSVKTIQRWDKAGLLPVVRTATNQRRIPVDAIHRVLNAPGKSSRCAIYARVASVKQEQQGNLLRQVERLQQVARERGYLVVSLIQEQASGLNEKRKGLKRLLALIEQQEIDLVLIEARTTKLLLDLSRREQGGANAGKRAYLGATVEILNAARRFYLDFFLAQSDKLTERVKIISKQTGEVREGVISAENLLTWAEFQTVATREHPDPLPDWNFSQTFPDFPNRYRRSVIKDVIGKARGYLTALGKWQHSGKKKGQPGDPPLPIIPPSTRAPFAWISMNSICVRALSVSRSMMELHGYGSTILRCTTAILNRGARMTVGKWKVPN
jgi:excisionase family DNA binding protein